MGYYMGDYYAGDPGFFSFLGKIAKPLVGMIPGVGPIASGAIGALSKVTSGGAMQVARQAAGKAGAIVAKHPVLTAAGAAGAITAGGAAMRGRMPGAPTAAGMSMQRAGARGRRMSHLQKYGVRKRPSMNACNPRALRRAIRRTHSFAKLAMKTIHLVHPKKKATFGGFRKKRSKR